MPRTSQTQLARNPSLSRAAENAYEPDHSGYLPPNAPRFLLSPDQSEG
jgi:hypothetical protein